MSSPSAHALLSASSAHRWLECTAAPRFEADFPDDGEVSVYAREGTLAHEICERRGLFEFGKLSADELSSELAKLAEDELYKQEMLRTSDVYVDYLKLKANGFKHTPTVVFEQRVDFSRYVPDGFGTCDCIMIGDDVLHITDYKHGKGVAVSPVGNPQMRLYALGALELFGPIYDIKRVSMAICQPRLHEDVEEDELTVEELIQWGEEFVKPKAIKAYAGNGDYQAGEHCRFCRGRALCRARAEAALSLELDSKTQINRLPDEAVGDLIKRAKWLKDWYEDLTEYALKSMIDGKKIKGYKLVEGRSVRAFDDADAVFSELEKAGWDSAMLYNRKPKTLSELEDMVGKKQFAKLVGNHIVKPAGKPTLAELGDKRKEYSSAAVDFKDVIK